MCMLTLFIQALAIAFVLYVWLKTDAFHEYVSDLPFVKRFNLFYIAEYEDYTNPVKQLNNIDRISTTYIQYLQTRRNSFFTRLITCPICLSFWLSLFSASSLNSALAVAFCGSFLFYSLVKIIQSTKI